ncbi:cyclase family protein [Brucella anthropi]|uniref:cyclase family protein n=1 Tax=Brucella anthropi TaxID=529 RepID=UPI00124E95B5|nr:cyclase family protein [Brucella anthropi]KAB2730819.1 cyclase family protein [Brucella anthropi]
MPTYVDLTVPIENVMPAHQTMPRPVVLPFMTHENSSGISGVPGDWLTSAIEYIGILNHVGTHVDAFFHTNPTGAKIDEMPLDIFMGTAVCLDLTHIPDLGDIDVADMEAAERKAGVKIKGHIVLINTGLHARHYPRNSVMHSNPGLTAAATHWLADRGSKLHGIEGPSTDRPNSPEYPSHRVCRDRGITHVEWLCNLEKLVGKGEFYFQAIPLLIAQGSGSPVRAFAQLD